MGDVFKTIYLINFTSSRLSLLQENSFQFRSGKKVSVDQFQWYNGYPKGTNNKTRVGLNANNESSQNGVFNQAASYYTNGVICEFQA